MLAAACHDKGAVPVVTERLELIGALSLCDGFASPMAVLPCIWPPRPRVKDLRLFENSRPTHSAGTRGYRALLLQPTTLQVADISVDQVRAAVQESSKALQCAAPSLAPRRLQRRAVPFSSAT